MSLLRGTVESVSKSAAAFINSIGVTTLRLSLGWQYSGPSVFHTIYKRRVPTEGMEADRKADFGWHYHPDAHSCEHGRLNAKFLNAARLLTFPIRVGMTVGMRFIFGDERLPARLRRHAVTTTNIAKYRFSSEPVGNISDGELPKGDNASRGQRDIVQRRRECHYDILGPPFKSALRSGGESNCRRVLRLANAYDEIAQAPIGR